MLDVGYKEKLIGYVSRFVRIPSRSSAQGGEEEKLQLRIKDIMENLGARVRSYNPDELESFRKHPLCHGPERQYTNRLTVIGEIGPSDAPALLLLAHSDTTFITDPGDWSFDPFSGKVADNHIHGLGSSDDKWGLAVMLIMMEVLKKHRDKLKKKIIFASTIDEESGVANGTLLLHLAGVKAEAALYLDGSGYQISIGTLGGSNYYLKPGKRIAPEKISRHEKLLKQACRTLTEKRFPLFEKPFLDKNEARNRSVDFYRQSDSDASVFMIAFYQLPGENRRELEKTIENMVSTVLGNDTELYEKSFREPWFEPALNTGETALTDYLSESIQHITEKVPEITTISKQDNFVLINHSGIPTVSFGVGPHAFTGRGSPHSIDERINIDELWQGACITFETVNKWLDSENKKVSSDITANG